MPSGETRVFYLFDQNDRRELKRYVERELEHVDMEMEKTRQKQEMLREVDGALTEIQGILAQMKRIAEDAAGDPGADRQAMAEEFESLKSRIDHIAATKCAKWSAAESAYLRKLVADLNSAEL